MGQELYIYTGSAWKQATELYIYTGSAWKSADEAYIYTGSAWKQFWPEAVPPSFVSCSGCSDQFSCTAGKYSACVRWTTSDCDSVNYHVNVAVSISGGSYAEVTDAGSCTLGCSIKSDCYDWSGGQSCYFDNSCYSTQSLQYRCRIHERITHNVVDTCYTGSVALTCTAA